MPIPFSARSATGNRRVSSGDVSAMGMNDGICVDDSGSHCLERGSDEVTAAEGYAWPTRSAYLSGLDVGLPSCRCMASDLH